ncbi:unnamed protein product, partial [Choristocarpus tenellus]
MSTAPPTQDFRARVGDAIASVVAQSPAYPMLVKKAKRTMKNSNVGIDWDGEVQRLQGVQDWEASLAELLKDGKVNVPEYYMQPFHTYPDGNLCWEAAWEQELASKAVGARNFPDDAAQGEHCLRMAYTTQMERLGAVVDKGGLIVDMGCGTGAST